MSYSYTLRNIQTGTVEYTGLKAGEVHQITGISSQRVSRHAADGKVYGNTWKVSLDEDDYSEFWTDEMERDNGSWKLKGVEWKQIKPGAVITVPVWEKL